MTVRQFDNSLLSFGKRGSGPPQPFRENNRLQVFDRFLEIVVNQNIVILVVVLNLTTSRSQPATDHRFGVLAAFAQAPLQGLAVRRQYEDADRIGQLLLNLLGALHVNIEQKVVAFLPRLLQKPAGRAIAISVKVGMLEKFSGTHHLVEFFAGNEVVLLAILLTASGSARGKRDGEFKIRNQLEQFVDQGRLPRAGWRRDDVDQRPVGWAHSRFCTCSRDFSISAFMARPASVIFSASPASPEVFESRVLASRFISCSRKSSFLPISPPSSSNPRKCCTWFSSRTISSWMSLRSTSSAASCSTRSRSTVEPSNS